MTENPLLTRLRAATTDPTWVDIAGYAFEKIHTNVIARALTTRTQAAQRLAAALWKRASDEDVSPQDITSLRAVCEHPLNRGPGSVVDLCVELGIAGNRRQLAIEVKVDGSPDGAQLASMAEALGADPHRRLVLLTLGAAQVCRMENAHLLKKPVRIWRVADVLALREHIEAASPSSAVTRPWLEELEREELRRQLAFEDEAPFGGCGYRERLLEAYRYGLAAAALANQAGDWSVSIQPFGVVMSEFSSARAVPFEGTNVTLYMEVVDKILRVKAGAWHRPVDPRKAVEALLPVIRSTMQKHGFSVEAPRRVTGRSVTVLSIDPQHFNRSHGDFIESLRKAHTAWRAVQWPG